MSQTVGHRKTTCGKNDFNPEWILTYSGKKNQGSKSASYEQYAFQNSRRE